jgi:RND family efflux transporter MFP subunit
LKVGLAWRLAQIRTLEQKLRDTKVLVPVPKPREDLPDPVEYTVAQKKVAEGEMVKDAPNTTAVVFKLVLDTKLKFLGNAPERYFAEIQARPAGKRQKAQIHVEAYPGRVFTGEVTRVNPTVDRTSRTFQVEILVSNLQRELKAGGFAKAEVLTHTDPRAWTVPAQAIVSFAGTTKLFVLREGKAHAALVAPGVEGHSWVEVVRPAGSDLRPDDQVITSSPDQLAEGMPVRVRTP